VGGGAGRRGFGGGAGGWRKRRADFDGGKREGEMDQTIWRLSNGMKSKSSNTSANEFISS
jgi:hypothetical protein